MDKQVLTRSFEGKRYDDAAIARGREAIVNEPGDRPQAGRGPDQSSALFFVLLAQIPLLFLFLLPGTSALGMHMVLWMFFLVSFTVTMWMVAPSGSVAAEPEQARDILPADQPPVVSAVMAIESARWEAGIPVYRGRLSMPAADALARLDDELGLEHRAMLQGSDSGDTLVIAPAIPAARAGQAKAIGLFVITLFTTVWAGAAHRGVDVLATPVRLVEGLPYALTLLGILGVVTFAQVRAARRHGVKVGLPYFIPFPFWLGTLGAFVQLRSLLPSRKAVFDLAAAGPIAALAMAVPALLLGLQWSTPVAVVPGTMPAAGTAVGSSLVLALLAKLSLGSVLTYSSVLQLHPVAFAGWLGLLLTGLNLLPIGGLAGGRLAQSLFGTRRAAGIGSGVLVGLLVLALLVWPGLMFWALLAFVFAGTDASPRDDVTPVGPGRRWLGFALLLLGALILLPLPHALWTSTGLRCPYV